MAAKALLVLASALFVQSAMSHCLGSISEIRGCGYDSLGYADTRNIGCGYIAPAAELVASHGGGLGVASASAIPPVGLAVASDNAYEGCVGFAGNLPFLGTAAVEGVFPAAGAGAINYGCGDGMVAITAEGPVRGAFGYGADLGYGAGLGYKGYGGCGCGCGVL